MVDDTSTVDTARMLAELRRQTESIMLIKPPTFTVEECEKRVAEARQELVEILTYTEDDWQARCETHYAAEVARIAKVNATHRPEFLLYTAMAAFIRKKMDALTAEHEAWDGLVLMLDWVKLLINDNVRPAPQKLTWETMRRIITQRAMWSLSGWENRLADAKVAHTAYAARQQRAAVLLEIFGVE